MEYAVWVDKGFSSELVRFSHDGRKRRSLLAHAITVAAANEGEATQVAPMGSSPTEVQHITAKQRNALLGEVS